MSLGELKEKKTKDFVPACFLREYVATIQKHQSALTELRDVLERKACKCPKLFVKRVPVDSLAAGEAELSKARKTLKAWKAQQHIYMNDTEGSGKKKGNGEKGNENTEGAGKKKPT